MLVPLFLGMGWFHSGTLSGQEAELYTDPRDGSVYHTVEIGRQVWMAENLNFRGAGCTCYNADPEKCEKYGGLYTWEEAQEVCPPGWHLPSGEEWEALSSFLGTSGAGQKIKASPEDPIPWDGNNETGFTALPAGAGNGEGFQRMGDWALFWSSTSYDERRAWFAQLDGFWYEQPPKYRSIYIGWYYLKSNQFSVRCIRNEE